MSCRKTFRNFLMWAKPEPKSAEFPLSCAQPTGKVFPQINGRPTDGKLILQTFPFGGLNPPDVDNPKHYNPKIEEIFGIRKFISSILSDVEKYSEFNRGIICQIRAKMAEISPLKLRGWAPRYRSNETTIARKQFFAAWSSRLMLVVNTDRPLVNRLIPLVYKQRRSCNLIHLKVQNKVRRKWRMNKDVTKY